VWNAFCFIGFATNNGGDEYVSKIEFLVMLMSVFVGLSYIPVRTEAKKTVPGRPLRHQRDA
jgi:hypothetical protein